MTGSEPPHTAPARRLLRTLDRRCAREGAHAKRAPASCARWAYRYLPAADIAWNRPLKQRLRQMWFAWITQELNGLPESYCGGVKGPTRDDAISWVTGAWSELAASTISNGFNGILAEAAADKDLEVASNSVAERLESLNLLQWESVVPSAKLLISIVLSCWTLSCLQSKQRSGSERAGAIDSSTAQPMEQLTAGGFAWWAVRQDSQRSNGDERCLIAMLDFILCSGTVGMLSGPRRSLQHLPGEPKPVSRPSITLYPGDTIQYCSSLCCRKPGGPPTSRGCTHR